MQFSIKTIGFTFFKGGGVQAFQTWKHDFDLWVGGDCLDMYQQLEGGFGSMRAILPILGLGEKNGSKTETLKNGRVIPIQSWGKSGVLAYFGLKIGYFGHIYWDMDFKFVLPIIYINIEGQTQLEVN